MNLKQLIKFGLENSSDPVIKNPVLRSALEKPRSMDQAALVDELEPGSLKDEMLGKFNPDQETYEEYLRRINLERPFNMNQGGRIGFMSGLSARTQNLVSLYDIAKLDLPIPEDTIRMVFQTKDRAKAYKKIFKDNGIKIVAKGKQRKALFKKPTQKQIDGVWKDTIKLVKEGKGTVPDKMRIPFKNEVLKIFDEFNQTGTPFSTSDIYYKLVENVQDNPRIFLPGHRS